jgi:hypothetical protein
MLTHEAIKLLLDQGGVLHQMTQPKDGLPLLVLRDSYGCSRVQPFHEVPTLEVTLDSVKDLGAWLKKHAHPDTAHILVDEDQIDALLDARHPRSHRAVGSLSAHPLWKRWADILGKALTQKQLLAVLRSGANEILGDPRGQMLRAALGALTVRTGTQYRAEIDERGMTRLAAADANNAIDQEIPDTFEVVAPLFVGVLLTGDGDTKVEPHYRVAMEVGVEVVQGVAYFKLSAPNIEVVKLRAREDVAQCLREQLDDRPWLVGLGSLTVERQLLLGEAAPCALASDPNRCRQTPPDFTLGPVEPPRGDSLYPTAPYPAPPFMQPPLHTPTHDDGNCGPAQADGTADAPDHS